MLPNFLGIGAERCATTWIYECLKEHPDIFVPDEKELHFFSSNYEKGLDWYRKWFQGSNGEKLVGEVSPEYIYVESVPRLIKATVPDVRLIASLRNPIERAYSQYGWRKLRNLHKASFREEIKKYPDYIRKGFYDEQLERYLCLFPRDKILILIYEDIESNPLTFVRGLYMFLGANDTFSPSLVDLRRNRGVINRDNLPVRLYLLLCKLAFLNSRRGLEPIMSIARRVKRLKITEALLERVVFNFGKDNMDHETREYLQEVFYQHNQRLSNLLGRDLTSMWR